MHKDGLTELEVVLAVAQLKGFTAAATELDMSTTAVSNAVAGLEARLGERLFHRTTRSVSLTEAGEQFVSEIRPAVASIRNAMAAVAERKAVLAGRLRINSSLGAALMIFEPFLAEFLRRYPKMAVEVVTEGRMVDVVGEGFDAGLRLQGSVPRDLVCVPITEEVPMAVVGSPSYFARNPIPKFPEDLAQHACVRARLPGGGLTPWQFQRNGEIFSVDVSGPLVLDAPTLMLQVARQGLGLAQLADWYISADVDDRRLMRVLQAWSAPAGGLCLYYSGHRHLPAGLRALVDLIHELREPRHH